MDNILNQLNDKQREAVVTTEGPVLILAGAGSGKTKALTHRIAYLMQEKGVSPYSILAVTFTNKAAGVMAERVASLLAQNPNPSQPPLGKGRRGGVLPWLGTFHSICVKILRRDIKALGYHSNFTIYDEQDSLNAVKRAMHALKIDIKQYNPRAVRSAISSAKCEMISAREYHGFAQGHFQELVARIYDEYTKTLRRAHALDFDDLLNKTVELFRSHPEVLQKYQKQFHYILVDEYQDTNHTQYLLCKMLAQSHKNIFVIGDDWQSVYSFRGARFRNILDFEKDYPEAKVIKLEENYRSTQNILDGAQAVIQKNSERSEKELWTGRGRGELITVFEAPEGPMEINFILQEINTLNKSTGVRLKDVVILYRTNAQSRAIEEMLVQFNIPYRIIGGLRFYERKEVKDILAYLRYIANKNDTVSLERIINYPPRKIGKKAWSEVLSQGINISSESNKNVQEFLKLIARLQKKAEEEVPSKLIETVLHESGIYRYLNDGSPENTTRLENIKELMSVAEKHESLNEFLENVALISDLDNYNEQSDALTLMTLHSAKGMEFPVVFMVGMEEGLFPHSQSSTDASQLEEERRLCYVGMTRAKNKLYLTSAKMRMMYGSLQYNERSRFIDDIPDTLLDEVK